MEEPSQDEKVVYSEICDINRKFVDEMRNFSGDSQVSLLQYEGFTSEW